MLNRKHLIILLLIAAGFLFHYTEIADLRRIFLWIESVSDYWWAWAVVLAAKIIFYALAMPGSSFIWIAAILYKPFQATLLIACGGTIGAILAYYLSKRISQKDKRETRQSVFFDFLQKNSNFSALCVARMIPGFPHSVINYGSGVINVPWPRFVSSTFIGFSIKGFVYSSAINEAVEISSISELGKFETLWPLLLPAGLMVIGQILKKLFMAGKQSGD